MVLLAEIEHEEVTDELAALYTDVLLQPCQASLKSCSNIFLCIATHKNHCVTSTPSNRSPEKTGR